MSIREQPGMERLSARTKRALQDYCALNTIITAYEALRAGDASRFDIEILETFTGDGFECERVRLKFDCPLGRRAAALGMLHRSGRMYRRRHA